MLSHHIILGFSQETKNQLLFLL
uniref:Uncharacterized protein n=1 Tax=Arundo donax TaxID=35708 RepID=A0A0A9GMJ6_ARUDO